MKKAILLILTLLMILPIIYGASEDGRQVWLEFNSSGVDSMGNYNFTCTNAVFNNGELDLDGSTAYCQYPDDDILAGGFGTGDAVNFTLGLYNVSFDNIDATSEYIVLEFWGADDGVILMRRGDNSKLGWHSGSSNGQAGLMNTTDRVNIIVTYNNDIITSTVYVDGTDADATLVDDIQPVGNGAYDITMIGAYVVPGNYFDGQINDLCIWDRVLTSAEIGEFMEEDGTGGCNFGAAAPEPPAAETNWYFQPTNLYFQSNVTSYAGLNITDNPINFSYNGTTDYNYTIPDYLAYWRFEYNQNPILEEYFNANLTNNGATFTASGYTGSAYDFDGTNDYMNYSTLPYDNSSFSAFAWVNTDDVNGIKTILGQYDDAAGSDRSFRMIVGSTGLFGVELNQDGGTSNKKAYNTQSVVADGSWHHVGFTWGSGNLIMYLDGSAASVTAADNDTFTQFRDNQADFLIGASFDTAPTLENYFNGTIDEVRLYNRTLTSTEVNKIYSSTFAQFSCNLYADGVLNQSANVTLNETFVHQFSYDSTEIETNVTFNVTCTDDFLTNSDQQKFFIDTILPNVDQSNIGNNSIYFHGIDTEINVSVSYVDTNLYAANLTLYQLNGAGTPIFTHNNTFVENINTTSYNLNFTFNINNLNNSRYMLRGTAWDSHTSKNLKYTGEETEKGVMYNGVLVFCPEAETFKMKPKIDRYEFDVEFVAKNTWYECFVAGTEKLTYLSDSTYKGHFVDVYKSVWADFVSDNIVDYNVQKVQDGLFKVDILINAKKIEIQSIGDLNTKTSEWFFNVTDGMTFYAEDAITGDAVQNFTVIVWDGATQIENKTTTAFNLTFNFTGTYTTNFTSPQYANNETGNISFTNGGSFTYNVSQANSLYLFFYDEQTNALINDRTVTVDVINFNNVSNTYTTATGSTFQSGFSTGSYQIDYSAPNYTKRSYYTTVVGSDTQTIDLYLLLSAEGDYNNLAVVDDSASALNNVTVKMQRYFVADNAWKIVEMAITNDEGAAFVFVERFDTSYRFVLDYQGSTQKITEQTKLGTLDLFFTLNLLTSPLGDFYDVGGVTVDLSFSNETNVWTYDYNTPSGISVSQGRLEVIKSTIYTDITVCNTTLVAASGAITCNQTAYSGDNGEFIAQSFVTINGEEYYIGQSTYNYKKDYEVFNLTGVLLSAIIIMIFAMIGIYNPSVSIALTMFGLFFTFSLGILEIQFTWLIGLLVTGAIYIGSIRT